MVSERFFYLILVPLARFTAMRPSRRSTVKRALSDDERLDRIKQYRIMIREFEAMNLYEDVRDLTAWVNVLSGPVDGECGRKRPQAAHRKGCP